MLQRPLLLRGQWAARSCGWSCGWLGTQQVGQRLHTPPPGSLPESRSRESPDEPRVGVGVVILRLSPTAQGKAAPEVVLIQRGKPPDKGKWSFPGGSLELGEVWDCLPAFARRCAAGRAVTRCAGRPWWSALCGRPQRRQAWCCATARAPALSHSRTRSPPRT